MRKKRFPGEYHRRGYLNQPNPELSSYLQECAKQNTVDRPSQLSYNDPWADWTKYPLVAWPQPQSNKKAPGLDQNSSFSPQNQRDLLRSYSIKPYENQETMYIEPLDYASQTQKTNMEKPYNEQNSSEHLPVEQVEFGSPHREVSENIENSEAGAADFPPEESAITEDVACEESNPVENVQSAEEMMEEKKAEKEAANFESMEQKQTQYKDRQVEVRENMLVWRGFPK